MNLGQVHATRRLCSDWWVDALGVVREDLMVRALYSDATFGDVVVSCVCSAT